MTTDLIRSSSTFIFHFQLELMGDQVSEAYSCSGTLPHPASLHDEMRLFVAAPLLTAPSSDSRTTAPLFFAIADTGTGITRLIVSQIYGHSCRHPGCRRGGRSSLRMPRRTDRGQLIAPTDDEGSQDRCWRIPRLCRGAPLAKQRCTRSRRRSGRASRPRRHAASAYR